MLGAYTVFANGGYRVLPYLIDRVTDADGRTLMQATNRQAGDESIRAITERNAYIMNTLLHGVAVRGTAPARRENSSAATSRAKRVRATTATTPGSAATRATRWPWAGWATTRPVRSGAGNRGRSRAADLDRLHEDRAQGRTRSRARPTRNRDPSATASSFYRDPVKGGTEGLLGASGDSETRDLVRDQIF